LGDPRRSENSLSAMSDISLPVGLVDLDLSMPSPIKEKGGDYGQPNTKSGVPRRPRLVPGGTGKSFFCHFRRFL